MRVVHEACRALGRDIVLGSTHVDTPHAFVDNLFKLNNSGAEV